MMTKHWCSGALDVWENDFHTYYIVPWSWLPPIDKSYHGDGKFRWLRKRPRENHGMHCSQSAAQLESVLQTLEQKCAAANSGIKVDSAFKAWFLQPHLFERMSSCTCCFFQVSDSIFLNENDGHQLVGFMHDSQGCVAWAIDLTNASVVYTNGCGAFMQCADSFEEFLHRLWLENAVYPSKESEAYRRCAQRNQKHTL